MCRFLLVFWFSLFALTLSGQVRKLKGLVSINSERVAGAIIKNVSLQQQTSSNDIGEFSIQARTGDTILTVKDESVRDTTYLQNQEFLIIQLKKMPLMLKEVVIKGAGASPAAIYERNKKEYKLIYFWGDNTGIFLSGSLVNIDKLNNALGKKGRESRRLQSTLTQDYKNSIIDKRFNPIAARITGYEGKKLSEFIQQNRPSFEMINNATDYYIIEYTKQKLSKVKGQ